MSFINLTWVPLIPKVDSVMALKDYRPITIIGSLYKIMSKLLSLRLRRVLGPLIDESQSSFVIGR